MVETTKTNAQGNYILDATLACYNRLPCGFCVLLGRDCPRMISNWPRDYDVACSIKTKANEIERKVAVVIPEAK